MTHTIARTGATRGFGRVAVERILHGDPQAHLVFLARGKAGPELATHLGREGRAVTSIPTDLLSLNSVRAATDEISRRLDAGDLPPLRGFVGNMVITVSDAHLGDFRHNLGMMPAPSRQEPAKLARIGAFPRPDTITAGRTAYSTSKLAAIYLVHEYARRLPQGIDIVAYNPGSAPGTGLARDSGAIAQFAIRRVLPVLTLTPIASSRKDSGQRLADVQLGRIAATSGSYVDRIREARSSQESYDPDRERQLWNAVQDLTQTSV